MLELIQTTTTNRSNDVSIPNGKKQTDMSSTDDPSSEFGAEYEAAVSEGKELETQEKSSKKVNTEADKDSSQIDVEKSDELKVYGESEGEELDTNAKLVGPEGELTDLETRAPILANRATNEAPKTAEVPPKDASIPAIETVNKSKVEMSAAAEIGPKPDSLAKVPTKTIAENAVMSKVVEDTDKKAPAVDKKPPLHSEQGDVRKAITKRVEIAGEKSANLNHTPKPGTMTETSDNPRKQVDWSISRAAKVWIDRPRTSAATQVTPASVPPNIAPSMSMAQSDLSLGKQDTTLTGLTDVETSGLSDPRAPSAASSTQVQQVFSRADTPAMVARQIAEVLQRLPDRPVEISLNPKELGRVRLNVSAVETGVTVTIVAERPETLDLMRRNIEQLTREFHAIGYQDINFAFSGGDSSGEFSDESGDSQTAGPSQLDLAQEEGIEVSYEKPIAETGVDIRL